MTTITILKHSLDILPLEPEITAESIKKHLEYLEKVRLEAKQELAELKEKGSKQYDTFWRGSLNPEDSVSYNYWKQLETRRKWLKRMLTSWKPLIKNGETIKLNIA